MILFRRGWPPRHRLVPVANWLLISWDDPINGRFSSDWRSSSFRAPSPNHEITKLIPPPDLIFKANPKATAPLQIWIIPTRNGGYIAAFIHDFCAFQTKGGITFSVEVKLWSFREAIMLIKCKPNTIPFSHYREKVLYKFHKGHCLRN